MRYILILLSLLLCVPTFAQESFYVKDASRYFDVKIIVDHCEGSYSPTCADQTMFYFALFDIRFVPAGCSSSSTFSGSCMGNASYSFYRKGSKTPYQIIREPKVHFSLDGDRHQPLIGGNDNLEECNAIYVADYNFDGMDDIAICTDVVGAYGRILFRVYLSSRDKHQFLYNKNFSLDGLYVPVVDTQKKVLRTFDKDGCCWHIATTYSVVNDKPKKIMEEVEDSTINDTTNVKVTTKTLVNGKWRTVVKMVPRNQ